MISHKVSHGMDEGLLSLACAFHQSDFALASFLKTICTAKAGFAAATCRRKSHTDD
jgi:hypothetical protein